MRDNLTASTSALGLRVKALAGLVYASVIGDETLAREARWLASRMSPPVDDATLDAIARFAPEPTASGESGMEELLARLESLPGLSGETALALLLAKAVSPSPATVPAPLVARVSKALAPEALVELVVWISIQQMLHRLGSFFDA